MQTTTPGRPRNTTYAEAARKVREAGGEWVLVGVDLPGPVSPVERSLRYTHGLQTSRLKDHEAGRWSLAARDPQGAGDGPGPAWPRLLASA